MLNQIMFRYMTNFLAQYFSVFLSTITALRELQSDLTSRYLRKLIEAGHMGTCCMTGDGSAVARGQYEDRITHQWC